MTAPGPLVLSWHTMISLTVAPGTQNFSVTPPVTREQVGCPVVVLALAVSHSGTPPGLR